MLYGAILGDIIGSVYEFDNGGKTREFPLFSDCSRFTDDTVMTIAVADALIEYVNNSDLSCEEYAGVAIQSMKKWATKYPNVGYGYHFFSWVFGGDTKPYGSYGNGAAMRISPVAWIDNYTNDEIDFLTETTTNVTHNHQEGIKAAFAEVEMIRSARQHLSKEEMRSIAESYYGRIQTLDEIRPIYHHVEDCMNTMPQAFECFLESDDYESCIRNVMYIGGDTDTLGAIAGAIAEAYYGIPDELIEECRKRLPLEMLDIIDKFEDIFGK